MKTFRTLDSLRLVPLAAALALLAGCASGGSSSLVKQERSYNMNSARPGYNVAYIDAVERAALKRGVDVVWFNPPKEKLVATVTSSE